MFSNNMSFSYHLVLRVGFMWKHPSFFEFKGYIGMWIRFRLHSFNSEDKKYGKLQCRNYYPRECRRPTRFPLSLHHNLLIGLQYAWMLIKKIICQALLSGCSAGGLASIIHCDEFRSLLPTSTKVKCLSDAGFFLDA